MASPATEIDAAGRTLRVSNPDRVIYQATAWSAEVTKLQVVEYYLAVAPGILRALDHRPTTLERWPKGVYEGIVRSTREDPHGDAFYQKRVPRGPRRTSTPPGSCSRRAVTRTRSARPSRPSSRGRRRWAR